MAIKKLGGSPPIPTKPDTKRQKKVSRPSPPVRPLLNAEQMVSSMFEPEVRETVSQQDVTVVPREDIGGASGMAAHGPEGPDKIFLSEVRPGILIHETTHRMDTVSNSDEFKQALDRALARGDRPRGVEDPSRYADTIEWMKNFPGVGGNPNQGWGGVNELFAELVARSGGDITKVPPELRPFVEQFLGPQLTQAQQADAARMLQMMPRPQEE